MEADVLELVVDNEHLLPGKSRVTLSEVFAIYICPKCGDEFKVPFGSLSEGTVINHLTCNRRKSR